MSWIETLTAFADERVHGHRREHVFPDGVVLGDVLDAIHAAGIAENYQYTEQLRVQYALNVCSRCARRFNKSDLRATLSQYSISAWGAICSVCQLEFLAMGRSKREL